ncbi:MAG: CapA family protein [Ignavibacteria bacterium]|nr:CapA family protein [Ignavibacteria bacterium]
MQEILFQELKNNVNSYCIFSWRSRRILCTKSSEDTKYFSEDRNVYEFSHEVIDAGADIVFGHGPHVPKGDGAV